MPLLDFHCANGHRFERLLPYSLPTIPCACGRPAIREWTSPPAVVGPTTDTRGMFRRFTEATAEIDHTASKIEANTGQEVRTPPLWTAAKRKAAAIVAAGENPHSPAQRGA